MKPFDISRCLPVLFIATLLSCQKQNDLTQFRQQVQAINLTRGDITLCGAEGGQFGKVTFGLSCSEQVQTDFNLATALLHSFEYVEAEKVFAKIIDKDPECLMAYWGVAMSNFHPLWTPPTNEELEKGIKTIELARSISGRSQRESDYLEAVAVLYDDWSNRSHTERLQKFEKAAEGIYKKYPDDSEAAIFYALSLRAASDPTDKTFVKQRKAGAILNTLFSEAPDHPGIAHYLIHSYDYPELADQALDAARKYAAIAATSAHALHMPSHIFTRLGLWNEAIQSNINSIAAARCYTENSGKTGHWDEELHGMDYLTYAYLQQGKDDMAKAQLDSLLTFDVVFPINGKDAYTMAAIPVRYALERKNWKEAASLQFMHKTFPWDDYPWEKSLLHFGRLLGNVHVNNIEAAKADLAELRSGYTALKEKNKTYEANQVDIQIHASEGWIQFAQGNPAEGIRLLTDAANMEDATDKHPVTPGEVIPARELLADLYIEAGKYPEALEAYEADLKRHPGRLNGLYGAGLAAEKSGDPKKAATYYEQLLDLVSKSDAIRPSITSAKAFMSTAVMDRKR